MSSNFTKSLYDKDAYDKKLQQSRQPSNYRLDPNYSTNCGQCLPNYTTSVAGTSLIDIDSMLRGMVPEASIGSNQPNCPDTQHPTIYSRLDNPAYTVRGQIVDQPRLDFPLFDPQCQIFENFHVNTRLQAKDNHVAVWQQPIDQTNILPPKNTKKPTSCKVTVNCK